jgi:CBS domain-containing protein
MCIAADATIEEAVALFCEHHCGAFPVMRSKVMVGILSRSDLLKAFRDFLGLEEPSRRIEIAIPHGASDLANTLSALKDEDEITSIIAARLRTDGAEPVLYIRTRTKNPWQLEKRLRAKGAILLARESLDSSE